MPEVLRQGSRGEEVRRLQKNLNAAIGRRYGTIAADGIFGPRTKQAVERYQKDFRLKSVDGIVGPETRNALATRVLIIEGTMSRSNASPAQTPAAQTARVVRLPWCSTGLHGPRRDATAPDASGAGSTLGRTPWERGGGRGMRAAWGAPLPSVAPHRAES